MNGFEFEFESVAVSFEGRPVLRDFSLAIAPGDKVIFRGPSGSGKSTLLRLLLGFARPDSGALRFRGEPVTPEIAWALRREVAYVNQSPGFETGTAARVFENFFQMKAAPEMPARPALAATLNAVDLDEAVLKQQIGDLSGGERQRIVLATALLSNRSIFLLDEPTAALDGKLKRRVADLFLEDQPGRTVIAAAHDEAWFEEREAVTLIDLSPPSSSSASLS